MLSLRSAGVRNISSGLERQTTVEHPRFEQNLVGWAKTQTVGRTPDRTRMGPLYDGSAIPGRSSAPRPS